MRKETRYGHWQIACPEFDPEEYTGFIYRVTFLLSGEMYIGKKMFHRMNKYGTKRYGPSDWKRYTTSSGHIAKLLEEYPIECFHFEIVLPCKTKGVLSHAESNILHKMDALTSVDNHGYPKFLNKQIDAVRWIAKDFPVEEVNNLCRLYLPFPPVDPYEN